VLLDDFGSGYSSFNTLKDIPLDILKIDMKFLEGFESSDKAGCILETIVAMAKTPAPGSYRRRRGDGNSGQVPSFKIGCRRVQGFFYSRPLPVAEFNKLLAGPAKLALG
jgi:EAL domain-containing protein (putative c-di-GMP-specific phosphodiesterase class I)